MKLKWIVVVATISIIGLFLAGCQASAEPSTISDSTDSSPSALCSSAVDSPDGSVPFGKRACAPDGTKYAQEIEPANQGRIGVFDADTNEMITEISVGETNNDLKGLAWSEDSLILGIMYHRGPGGYVSIVDVATRQEIERVRIDKWYHRLEFSKDGTRIITEGGQFPIKAFEGTASEESSQATTPVTSSAESQTPTPIKTSENVAASFTLPMQKGVTLASWQQGEYSSPTTDESLKLLAATGANHVAIIVTGYQETISSTTISRDTLSTPTDADLAHVIATAHRLGLSTSIKPHIDVADPDYWRGEIGLSFTSEEDWRAWFQAYSEFITYYADLAEANGASALVVGTELVGTTHREAEWRDIIAEVRDHFRGTLTYASNHSGEELQIGFWDSLDLIGVDAYYPLTDKDDPTIDELKDAWVQKGYVQTLESLANEFNRPIIFTEIGYRSLDGGNKNPWDWHQSGSVDLQEQADAYQAAFEVFWNKPFFAGAYWWTWSTKPEGETADTGFSPQGKPAENVLRSFYLSTSLSLEPTYTPSPTSTSTITPIPTSTPTSSPTPTLTPSPDPTATPVPQPFIAKRVVENGVHYQVINTQTNQIILTSHAQYSSPNDAKAKSFSSDFTKFTVAYHYGHAGAYTWIGVWSTETGDLLNAVQESGYIRSIPPGVFNQ